MHTAIDKIRELRALHDDGLLSRDEFERRKNAILDAEYAPPGRTPGAAGSGPGSAPGSGTEIGLMTGQEVGPANRRYRLERMVALGGMGQVWQALDLATHAELGHSAVVALKIIPPQLTHSPHFARLLVEEATRARALAHEHIVRVYDWAQDPATMSYFIIMEYLDGEDLAGLMSHAGALPLERVLNLLEPVGVALDYAWEKQHLVHRDIKPANVFVTKGGDVKLLDFGIAARSRGAEPEQLASREAPADSGTLVYRAPESNNAAMVPVRTLDVYAVAVMIYQMLTGRAELAHLPDQSPGSLTPAQWGALQEGFAFDPKLRQPSVTQLLARLRGPRPPSADDLVARQVAAQVRAEKQAAQQVARRKAEEQAVLARALVVRQRKEQEQIAQREAETARRARRVILREQLRERRALDAAKAQAEQDEAQRKANQAKAAAAYLSEQQRARAEAAARNQAELAQLLPSPDSPVADPQGILRDTFADGAAAPELVLIATGRFHMGSPEHERAIALAAGAQRIWLARETPQHWVGIERPLAMGRTPVTVGEWRRFASATGWRHHGDVDWEAPGFTQTDTHPVVGVSWNDVQLYLVWLCKQTGQRYRLPTEAEWEYACRAGTRTAFSTGDTIHAGQANYDASFSYNGGATGVFRRGTTPVGAFAPNPWGLLDMHGNVWEWVQDVVHDTYDGAPTDGSAWRNGGDQSRHILRGGCWLYHPRYLRSALRNGFSATMANDIVGFRVVRELMHSERMLESSISINQQ
ncbi:SUMF1/EgtB/PvdO family nonheme iron enzyme [Massilia sp. S19_KUP03_FR1]|uniref:SUMF1/EgtB/PvdO family nonheme iron enzyme n=1 Tax=Massilia sp. S19_KUP03_FR1 TaxID=3025503 RepID=UPI002FCD76ED